MPDNELPIDKSLERAEEKEDRFFMLDESSEDRFTQLDFDTEKPKDKMFILDEEPEVEQQEQRLGRSALYDRIRQGFDDFQGDEARSVMTLYFQSRLGLNKSVSEDYESFALSHLDSTADPVTVGNRVAASLNARKKPSPTVEFVRKPFDEQFSIVSGDENIPLEERKKLVQEHFKELAKDDPAYHILLGDKNISTKGKQWIIRSLASQNPNALSYTRLSEKDKQYIPSYLRALSPEVNVGFFSEMWKRVKSTGDIAEEGLFRFREQMDIGDYRTDIGAYALLKQRKLDKVINEDGTVDSPEDMTKIEKLLLQRQADRRAGNITPSERLPIIMSKGKEEYELSKANRQIFNAMTPKFEEKGAVGGMLWGAFDVVSDMAMTTMVGGGTIAVPLIYGARFQGELADSLVFEHNVDPANAGQLALLASIPYAAIERLQIKGLTKVAPRVLGRMGKGLKAKLIRFAIESGKTYTVENVEEFFQSGIEKAAKSIAKEALEAEGVEYKDLIDAWENETIEAAKVMFPLSVLRGGAVGFRSRPINGGAGQVDAMNELVNNTKEDAGDIDLEPTEKVVDEESERLELMADDIQIGLEPMDINEPSHVQRKVKRITKERIQDSGITRGIKEDIKTDISEQMVKGVEERKAINENVISKVKEFQETSGIDVNIFEEIPEDVPLDADAQAQPDGTINVYISNLEEDTVEKTILHEAVVHIGLRNVVPDFDNMLDSLLADPQRAEQIRQFAVKTRQVGLNNLSQEQKRVVAEEYIASAVEDGLSKSEKRNVVSRIRNSIRSVFGLKYTTADIEDLVEKAKQFQEPDPNVEYQRRFSRRATRKSDYIESLVEKKKLNENFDAEIDEMAEKVYEKGLDRADIDTDVRGLVKEKKKETKPKKNINVEKPTSLQKSAAEDYLRNRYADEDVPQYIKDAFDNLKVELRKTAILPGLGNQNIAETIASGDISFDSFEKTNIRSLIGRAKELRNENQKKSDILSESLKDVDEKRFLKLPSAKVIKFINKMTNLTHGASGLIDAIVSASDEKMRKKTIKIQKWFKTSITNAAELEDIKTSEYGQQFINSMSKALVKNIDLKTEKEVKKEQKKKFDVYFKNISKKNDKYKKFSSTNESMTKDQLMHLYNAYLIPENRDKAEEHAKKKKFKSADDMLKAMESTFTKEDLQLIKTSKELNAEMYKDINEIKSENNEEPISIDDNLAFIATRSKSKSLKEERALMKATFDFSNKPKFIDSTISEDREIREDVGLTELTSMAMNSTAKWVGWNDDNKFNDILEVFGDKELLKNVENLFGDSFVHQIKTGLSDMFQGGFNENLDPDFFLKALGSLRTMAVGTKLGLNPVSAAKQFTSIPQVFVKMDFKNVLENPTSFINPKHSLNTLPNFLKTSGLKRRWGKGYDEKIGAYVKSDAIGRRKKLNDVMSALLIGVRGMDLVPAFFVAPSMIDAKMTEIMKDNPKMKQQTAYNRAANEFWRDYEETQQSSNVADIGETLRRNDYMRLFGTFGTTMRQDSKLATNMTTELLMTGDKTRFVRKAAALVSSKMLYALAGALILKGRKKLTGDDDDEPFFNMKFIFNSIYNSFFGVYLNGIPLLGKLVENSIKKLFGQKAYPIRGLPLVQSAEDIVNVFKYMNSLFDEDKEKDVEFDKTFKKIMPAYKYWLKELPTALDIMDEDTEGPIDEIID